MVYRVMPLPKFGCGGTVPKSTKLAESLDRFMTNLDFGMVDEVSSIVPCTVRGCFEVDSEEESERLYRILEVAGLMCEWVNKTGDAEALREVLDAIETSRQLLDRHEEGECRHCRSTQESLRGNRTTADQPSGQDCE